MGLETATYISGLSSDNPTAVDQKSQGDDHMRLIKATIKNTFPNHSKPTYQVKSAAQEEAAYIAAIPADYGKIIPISCGTANRTVTLPTPTEAVDDSAAITFMKSDFSKFNVNFLGSIARDAEYVLHQPYQKAKFEWNHTLGLWVPWIEEKPIKGAVVFAATAPVGYFEVSGGTIGKGGTAATYANDMYLGIYQVLWDTYSNSQIAVSGGRGVSALADFQAGKLLTLFNFEEYVLAHKGSGAVNGSKAGADTHTLTADEIPQLTGSGTAASGGAHSHSITNGQDVVWDMNVAPGSIGQLCYGEAGAGANPDRLGSRDLSIPSGGAHTHSVTVTVNAGTADEHSILQKTAYMRLWMKF